ncbi:MAG: hypothetical protein Cons2KO_34070 [Congregibacter sp.]
MRKVLVYIVVAVGALLFTWTLFVAGSFAFVAAQGFVGTQGREAGGELLVALTALALGCAAGYLLIRFGARTLNKVAKKSD